ESELLNLFAGSKSFSIVKLDHPAFSTPNRINDVEYRSFTKRMIGNLRLPRIRGLDINGRTRIFLSPENIAGSRVGQPVDGITGSPPASATALTTTLILYAPSEPKPPPSQAAPK